MIELFICLFTFHLIISTYILNIFTVHFKLYVEKRKYVYFFFNCNHLNELIFKSRYLPTMNDCCLIHSLRIILYSLLFNFLKQRWLQAKRIYHLRRCILWHSLVTSFCVVLTILVKPSEFKYTLPDEVVLI